MEVNTKTAPTVKQVAEAIQAQVVEYWNKYSATPWDINNGLCDEFAEDVVSKFSCDRDELFTLSFFEITNTGDDDWTDFYEKSIEPFNLSPTRGLSKQQLLDVLFNNADQSHVWVVLKKGDRYIHFDAEIPSGVDNPFKLPTYDKFMKGKSMALEDGDMEKLLRKYKEASISKFKKSLSGNEAEMTI